MSANEDDVAEQVRLRLRELRHARGATLEAVASRAGMDVSTLSRLESGKRRLTLDHLPPLAAALGVAPAELLGTPAVPDPRVRAKPRTVDGLTMWPLTREGPAGARHAFKIRVAKARNTPPDPLPVHEGQDWIYVLSGRMRLVLGTKDMVIAPGEAVEFGTLTPHWFGVVEEPVELIGIFDTHGERLHLHR